MKTYKAKLEVTVLENDDIILMRCGDSGNYFVHVESDDRIAEYTPGEMKEIYDYED